MGGEVYFFFVWLDDTYKGKGGAEVNEQHLKKMRSILGFKSILITSISLSPSPLNFLGEVKHPNCRPSFPFQPFCILSFPLKTIQSNVTLPLHIRHFLLKPSNPRTIIIYCCYQWAFSKEQAHAYSNTSTLVSLFIFSVFYRQFLHLALIYNACVCY